MPEGQCGHLSPYRSASVSLSVAGVWLPLQGHEEADRPVLCERGQWCVGKACRKDSAGLGRLLRPQCPEPAGRRRLQQPSPHGKP